LRWSVKDLADRAEVGTTTINRMEIEDGFPIARGANIQAVHGALVAAGIIFLGDSGGEEGPGIRCRNGHVSSVAEVAKAPKKTARSSEAAHKSSRSKRR
jgi:hypothetical protein